MARIRLLSMAVVVAASLLLPNQSVVAATPSSPAQSPCTFLQKSKAVEVVTRQNRAFGAKDYKTALSYSSVRFRKSVTQSSFKSIVETNYAYLGKVSSTKPVACIFGGGDMLLAVTLVEKSGTSHNIIYILVPIAASQLLAPNTSGYGVDGVQVSS